MKVNVIGGGLAGCEASYQLLKRGVDVTMYEMKPQHKSPAHNLDTLCELVCSNSLKSNDVNSSSGLLKEELRILDSLVLSCADINSVPAGSALAVDRNNFSKAVTDKLLSYSNFKLVNEIVSTLPLDNADITIVATGPLTDQQLIPQFRQLFGEQFLYFFDAVAPIVTAESIDFDSAFVGSRYNKGTDDYINCPMDKATFEQFWQQLVDAQTVELKDFENNVFEGCMPIEVMAKRGMDTIRFGPLKPVGLRDPRYPDVRPYAVLQLRKENIEGTLYNLVGFQTNLKFGEQKRIFSLVPALKNAEFVRYGVMHRNTYINAPKFLDSNFRMRTRNNLFFAGQLTGVEGYVESVASGLVAGISAYRQLNNLPKIEWAEDTMIGALCKHVSTDFGTYSPMNSNFGILPPLEEKVRDKQLKKSLMSQRAIQSTKNIADLL